MTFDPVLPKDNYAQFVITAKDVEAREYLNQKLFKILNEDFPAEYNQTNQFYKMGPPADYPVMIRVSGYDVDKVKNIADEVAMKMRQDSNIYNVNFDWQEKAKTLHLELAAKIN